MRVIFEHHKPESLVGMIIAFWTHSPFCHTAISIDGWRYEALMSKGFTRTKSIPRTRIVETVIDVPDDVAQKMINWLERNRGTRYPRPAYLALSFIFPQLTDMARRLYCSQAILKCLTYAGLYETGIAHLRIPPASFYFVAQTLAARPDLAIIKT